VRSATEPIDTSTGTGKLMEGVLAALRSSTTAVAQTPPARMKAALEFGRWPFLTPLGYLNAPLGIEKVWSPTRNAR
jgi:hypothetical protein